jgi:hypothetical protein
MTARKNPASEPGRPAIRTKPVRVTVDLDPATYTEPNRWVGGAAIAVNPDFPRLPLAGDPRDAPRHDGQRGSGQRGHRAAAPRPGLSRP